jgi:hypothetical protein
MHYTRLREKMKNEERAHLESHYQRKLESIKNKVAQMTTHTLEKVFAKS